MYHILSISGDVRHLRSILGLNYFVLEALQNYESCLDDSWCLIRSALTLILHTTSQIHYSKQFGLRSQAVLRYTTWGPLRIHSCWLRIFTAKTYNALKTNIYYNGNLENCDLQENVDCMFLLKRMLTYCFYLVTDRCATKRPTYNPRVTLVFLYTGLSPEHVLPQCLLLVSVLSQLVSQPEEVLQLWYTGSQFSEDTPR